MANLGPENLTSTRLRSATKHYNMSIQYVNESIGSVNRDSASTLAAIMTLMMAERSIKEMEASSSRGMGTPP
ncbi:unnamed protein product [Penicillium pancosmium]